MFLNIILKYFILATNVLIFQTSCVIMAMVRSLPRTPVMAGMTAETAVMKSVTSILQPATVRRKERTSVSCKFIYKLVYWLGSCSHLSVKPSFK